MDRISHRMFGWFGILGAVTSLVTVLTLDALVGGEPLRGSTLRRLTISEYVYSAGRWAFVVAVLALAIGSVLLLYGLILSGAVRAISVGSLLMSLWVAGLAAIVAFPKHNWAIGASGSGTVHRVATLVAFVALPAAVLVIARGRARAARWLAIGAVGWLSVLFGAIGVGIATDRSWWRLIPLGLVERGIAGFEVLAVIALGVWLARQRV